jgi:glycyl-tRNA synthetase beta chain
MAPSTKRNKPARSSPPGAPRACELLFEIGTEELPYHFVEPAIRALRATAERLLGEYRLAYGTLATLGTPRRLTLVVESLSARQTASVKESMGPSKAVAFDQEGRPTKAAAGFAASQDVPVNALEIRYTPKGEYVFAVKREPGKPTRVLLPDLLRQFVGSLSFPKSMRWNESGLRFARPIRWLLAVYGGQPVPCEIAGIHAATTTLGHRFSRQGKYPTKQRLTVKNFKSYVSALERNGVIVDPNTRRSLIQAQLTKLANSVGGTIHPDEDLLSQAVFTTENPHAILGHFDPSYLSLPHEILTTSMKEHQGFFSVRGRDGNLLPSFVSVTNMKLPQMRLIQKGNERVLSARLADAKFFFDEDRKVRLTDRVPKLANVTFHQKLGTMRQKKERMVKLAGLLAPQAGCSSEETTLCQRAAHLCKADLLTGMVGEFPTLQGIMGGEYARHDGEPPEVCRALAEQYLPRSMEGELPQSLIGKVLSLTDRLDTIASFFHVGMVPTGSEDPFALRRHATAVVRIILEGTLRMNLGQTVHHAAAFVADDGFPAPSGSASDNQTRVVEFLFERLRYYGRTVYGFRDDVMDAVLASYRAGGLCDLRDLVARMKALQTLAAAPDFEPLMIGFRRAHRIVQKEQWTAGAVDPSRFQHDSETRLYAALEEAKGTLPPLLDAGDYDKALERLVAMKPAIDEFFVNVMVNADDRLLRANRLSLLYAVDHLFGLYADFSHIQAKGA